MPDTVVNQRPAGVIRFGQGGGIESNGPISERKKSVRPQLPGTGPAGASHNWGQTRIFRTILSESLAATLTTRTIQKGRGRAKVCWRTFRESVNTLNGTDRVAGFPACNDRYR
jgi:hypothetical protein